MTDNNYATLALSNPVAQVLQITLNRPEFANAFNTQMATDLMHCLEALAMDAGDQLVYLAPTRVNLQLTEERWPDIRFAPTRETVRFVD